MATTDDLIKKIAERMTDQNSKEERKSIPHYNGHQNDQSINQWIREAEAVSTLNEWNDETKKRYLASRFKGAALNWHIKRLQSNRRSMSASRRPTSESDNPFMRPRTRRMRKLRL